MCGTCEQGFIFEACDLATGRVKARLHPSSASWETALCAIGQGTINLAPRDSRLRDIWPGNTSIYISRVAGAGADYENPVCEGALYLDSLNVGAGSLSLGCKTIEEYLNRRIIASRMNFNQVPQGSIAAALVDPASADIALDGVDAGSQIARDRTYQPWSYSRIWELLENLRDVIDGIEWNVRHTRSAGHWSTRLEFVDGYSADRQGAGQDVTQVIDSKREAIDFGLQVSASDLANRIYAIGEGQEEDQKKVTVTAPDSIYPRYDVSEAWPTVTRLDTLREHGEGYLADHDEPKAVPSASLAGFQVDPRNTALGNRLLVNLDLGVGVYRGRARVVSNAWGVDGGGFDRSIGLVPLEPASQALLAITESDPDNCC